MNYLLLILTLFIGLTSYKLQAISYKPGLISLLQSGKNYSGGYNSPQGVQAEDAVSELGSDTSDDRLELGSGDSPSTIPVKLRAKNIELTANREAVLSDSSPCFGATRTVKQGADLGYEIEQAKPGETLLVEAGTYDAMRLDGIQGSSAKPIIVKAKGNGEVIVDGKNQKTALSLLNSKYIAFEGLTFKNGNYNGVYVQNSEYIVFVNNRIQNTYGPGLKISGIYAKGGTKSHHVDWIGGEISNTGTGLGGAYGESIYIGQAQQALDYTHNIWIEGVKITGNPGAEGIDLKGEVYNVTLLNNEIYNIQPGLHRQERGDSVTQTNDSAIQVAAGRGQSGYTDRFSNVWVVGNKIRNIGSNDPVRGNGIVIYNNPGVIVFDNEIDNVIGSGIRAFTCCETGDLDYMAYVFDNKISNTERAALDLDNGKSRVSTKKSDVPNSIWNKRPKRQTWYKSCDVNE